MTKILGIGHSHVVAVAQGCYSLQDEGLQIDGAPLSSHFVYLYGPEYTPTLVGETDAFCLNPNLVALIDGENPDLIVLCVGGNEHIALSITQTQERIDFILGAEPDLALAPGATILPEAAVRETLRDHLKETRATIAAIRASTSKPIALLEPPPPLPDVRVLEHPAEFFHRAVTAQNLSPELFRYKVWRVQSALYREVCAACNIRFVTAPDEFIAPPGVLAQAGWGADASHANKEYGQQMILRACETIQSRLIPADLQ